MRIMIIRSRLMVLKQSGDGIIAFAKELQIQNEEELARALTLWDLGIKKREDKVRITKHKYLSIPDAVVILLNRCSDRDLTELRKKFENVLLESLPF